MISVQIINNIPKGVKEADKVITRNAIRHVNRVANYFNRQIRLGMRNTPKTGREYPRQQGKKTHIASSAGNPPAIDTGRLVNSILTRPATAFGRNPIAKVSTNVEYAERLELILKRMFMGKESKAYNLTRIYANKIAKTIMVK
tara:strand:- start:2316 stop:2744 length:429 start_codon:yes stop_codon:yes gene_type:complete